MKLLVGESSGAVGSDVNCGEHCLPSFDDLRFTAIDGEGLLSYWIESITGTTPNQIATVWIKFDSIGTNATTFYMYYGNSEASPVSDSAETFIFFDDFERDNDGDVLDRDWTENYSPTSISTEQAFDGTRSGKLGGLGAAYATILASADISIQLMVYREPLTSIEQIIHGNGTRTAYLTVDAAGVLYYVDNFNENEIGTVAAGEWNRIEINNFNWTSYTYDIWLNSVKLISNAVMQPDEGASDQLYIKGHYEYLEGENLVWMDQVIARNWKAVEPAWGSWGNEEIPPTIIDADTSENATISDLVEGMRLADNITEGANISDIFDPMHLSEVDAEAASIAAVMKGSDLYGTTPESAIIGDAFIDNYETNSAAAESASIDDNFVFEVAKFETINDGLGLGDAPQVIINIHKSIAESLDLVDENIRAFPREINDVLFIYDTLRHGWGLTADESLVLTDEISTVLGLLISDWLGIIDTQSNNWTGQDIINDTLNLFDVVEKYLSIADTLQESLTLTDADNFILTVTVLEYLGFSSLALGMKTMAQLIEENFDLEDASNNAFIMLIEEVLQSVDVISVIANLYKSIQESLSFDESLVLGLTIGKSVNESLVLTDVIANQGSFFTLVSDTLRLNVEVELAGEVYECYVLNTPKFQPSMYSGFNFNSYCVFENRAFGANDLGIFELTGSTDAGSVIHTGAILNKTDFGSRHQKRFRRGYIGVSGTSPVMVIETEDGSRQVYTINEDGKVVFQHDQKSKKWKLSIADFDTLETMQLVPIILTR
jgi:hypothetical protein